MILNAYHYFNTINQKFFYYYSLTLICFSHNFLIYFKESVDKVKPITGTSELKNTLS